LTETKHAQYEEAVFAIYTTPVFSSSPSSLFVVNKCCSIRMEEEEDEKGILFIQKQSEHISICILRGKGGGGGGREANPEARWTDLFRSLIKLEIALLGGTLRVPRVQFYYTFIEYIYIVTLILKREDFDRWHAAALQFHN
jgi:hypothetical protein